MRELQTLSRPEHEEQPCLPNQFWLKKSAVKKKKYIYRSRPRGVLITTKFLLKTLLTRKWEAKLEERKKEAVFSKQDHSATNERMWKNGEKLPIAVNKRRANQ